MDEYYYYYYSIFLEKYLKISCWDTLFKSLVLIILIIKPELKIQIKSSNFMIRNKIKGGKWERGGG